MSTMSELAKRLDGMFVRFATETEDEAAIRRVATAREAAKHIDELERENAVLREALKPFVDEAANFACDEDDGETFLIPNSHRLRIVEYEGTITESMMTIGDFRRAAALAGSGEK